MKSIKKRIQIEFASPKIRAVDEIRDLRTAVERAGLNLFSRYDIRLQSPIIDDGRVIIEVIIPIDQAEGFACGNRLRGISAYLLKQYKEKYEPYLIGNRLLSYTELPGQRSKKIEIDDMNRFDAMAEFATLMGRDDDEAKGKVNRIMAILNEGR